MMQKVGLRRVRDEPAGGSNYHASASLAEPFGVTSAKPLEIRDAVESQPLLTRQILHGDHPAAVEFRVSLTVGNLGEPRSWD
jgi:hypothetical protein